MNRVLPRRTGDALAEELLAEAGQRMQLRRFEPGSCIQRAGDRPAELSLLRSGRVELARERGSRRITVQVLEPPAVFGDVPLLTGAPNQLDVRAMTDVELLVMPSVELLEVLRGRPRLVQGLVRSLAARLSYLQGRMIEALSGDVCHRLALYLLYETSDDEVALSQTVLSELLGAHRSSISRALKELEAAGMVELGYRRVRVLDRAGLEEAVNTVAMGLEPQESR